MPVGSTRGRALVGQQDLLGVQHRSLQQHRLKKFTAVNPERVYAARWKKLNKHRGGEWSFLERILGPHGPQVASQRDADVAATVVQWLGTNIGRGFVLECEREIEALVEASQEKPRDWTKPYYRVLEDERAERRAAADRRRLAGRDRGIALDGRLKGVR